MIDPNELAQRSVSRFCIAPKLPERRLAMAAAISGLPPAPRKAFWEVLLSRSLLTTAEKEIAP